MAKRKITVQEPKAKRSGASLVVYPVIAAGLSLLGALACAALLYLQFVRGGAVAHDDALAARTASSYAAAINGRQMDLRAQLTRLAASKAVREALASDDPEARNALARELTELIPHARRVDLIPHGQARVDRDAATPINFAALEVIREAEVQAFAGPEYSASPRDLVFTSARVSDASGRTQGVLFAALSTELFLLPLRQFDAAAGLVQVQQAFPNTPPTIALSYGNGSPSETAKRIELNIPNWAVLFSGASAPGTMPGIAQLLLPLLIGFGLALAGIGLAFSRLRGHLRSDARTLADYAGKLMRGRNPAMDQYALSPFEHLAGRLTSDLSAAADITATLAARSGRSAAATEQATSAKPKRAATAVPAAAETAAAEDAADEDFLDLSDPIDDGASDSNSHSGSEEADDNFGIGVSEGASPVDLGLKLDAGMFRAYDIRGIVDDNLTRDAVYWIGRAFASEARNAGQRASVVGHDGRLSSPALSEALCRGITEGGVDVIDVGQVATPMLYFATHAQDTGTGVMITGSHNPPEYNGLKMMIGGVTLAEAAITRLHERILSNDLDEESEHGTLEKLAVDASYLERIMDDVALAQSLKVVVDCGNGVAGAIAPRLISELGCEVIPLYCEVDGTFPNHHPDPADPANLEDLITVVQAEEADIGLAFDGDGDRLGVVTGSGKIIWPDRLLMLFARDIVGRNPGADVIYDVKCSRHLNTVIAEHGGRPIMWKTGHSHIKAKLQETGALLAGEFSGHIAFGERWYGFDDALYSAARLLEIVSAQTDSVDDLFAELPDGVSTPELKIETTETAKFEILDALKQKADFADGTVTDIDGVRVDYSDGWGLIRASNTSPVLTLRFEADDDAALSRVQQVFRQQLAMIDGSLSF